MMKNKIYIITLFIVGCTFFSCDKDFLSVKKDIQAEVTVHDLFSNYTYGNRVLWKIYSYLPDGFADLYLEAASDNAEATDVGEGSQVFNRGTWSQFKNPDDVWSHYFDGIRNANLYLERSDSINIEYIKDKISGTDSTEYYNAVNNLKFMRGEVFFLKAFFYFELVKRYGEVPVLNKSFDYYQDKDAWKGVERSPLNECIQYIVSLCDSASAIIPEDLSPYGWYDKGRVTYGAILALKAKTLLYGASPLFTDNGSQVTWADAARAAHDVIALGKYSLDPNYEHLFGSDNRSSSGVIFYRQYGKINWLEYNNFPIVFQNSNGKSIAPTENLVDQFEVVQKDGSGNIISSKPFDWNNASDVANPYVNRDPRFYATVVYNGSSFSGQTIETFRGGNSGLPKPNASKTGYYLNKWVDPAVDLINATTTDHTWIYFRYGGILLDYAEAMFNAYGANADPQGYGMTALDAINEVRNRVNMPGLTASELNQKSIEHERNVEMSFEGQRYWDIRRWEKGTDYFNKPVYRMNMIKDGSTITYSKEKLENRVFEKKMNWYPIPRKDISLTDWKQNPEW